MKRAAIAAVLLAANGVNLFAAEADEPLAGVKQELKQLKSDSAAQKNGVDDPRLKGATPPVVLQPQAPRFSDQINSKRKSEKDLKELKKQQEAEKNWLVREYEKLESEADPKRAEGKSKLPESQAEEKSDSELLRDQLSANDRKTKEARDDSTRHLRAEAPRTPDPFAPFMKDWLANSPSSGPAFDALTKTGSGQTAGPGSLPPGAEFRPADLPTPTTAGLLDAPIPDARRERGSIPTPATNPFLAGLELPGQLENGAAAPSRGPVADSLAPVMVPPAKAPLTLSNEGIAPSKRNPVAPPASKQAEDKKYFPQQKRF